MGGFGFLQSEWLTLGDSHGWVMGGVGRVRLSILCEVLRKLKLWCISGPNMGQVRSHHMKMYRKPTPSDELLSNGQLDARRMNDWDPLDFTHVNDGLLP